MLNNNADTETVCQTKKVYVTNMRVRFYKESMTLC